MHHLQLLGGLRVHGPSGPVGDRLPQRRPMAVLSVLAVSRALGCSRTKLLGLLWPDDDETHARHHLSDALTSVRNSIGHHAIRADGEMLYVDEAEVRCDVALFEDALAEGRLEEAVGTYRGPLLDGFYVPGAGGLEEWIVQRRERLADAYAAALERLAHAASTTGHHRAAADWLRRQVAHDPYNTRVVLKLLAELEQARDRPNALRCAEEHERRLRVDLGVEPDPALLRALQALRASAPPPLLAPGRVLGPPSPPAPEVGRAVPPVNGFLRGGMGRPRLGRAGRPGRVFAVSGAASLTVLSLAVFLRFATVAGVLPPEHWIVMPFSAPGDDTALSRYAAGLPTLIDVQLAGPPGPHVLDRSGVLQRWYRAGGASPEGLSDRQALRLAEQAGGGRLLLGTLVRVGDRVDVILRLLEVPSGAHRGVQAGTAPPESTTTLLGRLIVALRTQDGSDALRPGSTAGPDTLQPATVTAGPP